MKTSVKNQVIELVKNSPSQEICGFFYSNFNQFYYYSCKNISKTPEFSFEISQDDFLKVEGLGKIFGIFHSHINEDSTFSQADKDLAEEIDLPIFCYSEVDKVFREYRPINYKAQLQGREFIWGVQDCYSLVRDFYWNTYQYLLDDFDRDDDFEKNNSPIILNNFQSQGFEELEIKTNIKPNDVLIYKSIRYAFPHHFEIFLGNSKVLKHLAKQLCHVDQIDQNFFGPKYRIVRFNRQNQQKLESVIL